VGEQAQEEPRPRVLVVEDNDGLREGLVGVLSGCFEVSACDSGPAAVARIQREAPFDAVLTDLRLPASDGRSVVRAARARGAATRVMVMTAYASVESAVELMQAGADDYVAKPFDPEALLERLAAALPARGTASAGGPVPLVAESPAMQAVVELADRAAASDATVLLTGETGTGKELVAERIHARSGRAAGPLVKVHCAALPETLLESELFGHERGAFTGAQRQRRGRFEEADGGTLLLDEIGEVSPATQVKLLRVLQGQEFHRVGGTRSLRTNARIVAATHRDLSEERAQGRFREDLFYRLDVVRIHVPPLRERPEDAVEIAAQWLDRFGGGRALSEEARKAIEAHPWPGNVRQLANALQRAVVLAGQGPLRAEHLGLPPAGAAVFRFDFPRDGVALESVERELVLAALRRADFVQKDAARLLRISRRKLNYLVGKLGITHPRWRRNRSAEGGDQGSGASAPTGLPAASEPSRRDG